MISLVFGKVARQQGEDVTALQYFNKGRAFTQQSGNAQIDTLLSTLISEVENVKRSA